MKIMENLIHHCKPAAVQFRLLLEVPVSFKVKEGICIWKHRQQKRGKGSRSVSASQFNSYEGNFYVANDVESMSSDSFNLNSMDDDTFGGKVSFSKWYDENKDSKEIQTNNSVGFDADGDGTDELVSIMLYMDRNRDKKSVADIRILDYDNPTGELEDGRDADSSVSEKEGTWNQVGGTLSYMLSDSNSDDKSWVWSIEEDISKGLCSATAGDFDHDGMEEVYEKELSETSRRMRFASSVEAAVYCVMQSPPYWKEIQYNSETFVAGEVACKISVGSGSGTSGDWVVLLVPIVNYKYQIWKELT